MTSVTHDTPVALPIPEGKLEDLELQLKKLFPRIAEGTTAELNHETWDAYKYAQWAAGYWMQQADVAKLELRRQMGSAEKGTINGVPVIKHYQHPVKGHWVEDGDRDYLKATGK